MAPDPETDLVWCEEPICTWVGTRDALETARGGLLPGLGRCPVCGSAWVGHVSPDGEWVSPARPAADLRYDGYDPADDEFEADLDDAPSPLDAALDRAVAGRLDLSRPPTCRGDELRDPETGPSDREVAGDGYPPPPESRTGSFPRRPGTEAAWEVAELDAAPRSTYTIFREAPDIWRFTGSFKTSEVLSAGIAVGNRWLRGRPSTHENLVTATGIAAATKATISYRCAWLHDPGDSTWH